MKYSMVKGVVAALALGVMVSLAQAAVIIGTWEQSPDGWIDWGQGQVGIETLPSKYSYVTGVGVTHGNYALKMTVSGWNQNLAIKLQNVGHKQSFLDNRILLIDVTVPAQTTSGWAKIEEIVLNAQGISWGQVKVTSPVLFGWGEGGGPAQCATVALDYGWYIDNIVPTLDLGAGQPWWVEFIIATNASSTSHGQFIFDNARLVPEPASLALLSLGLLTALRRSRR